MNILYPFARLIEYLKGFQLVQLLTIFLRYLVSSAFIFASIPKILGKRFTQISVDDPVGFYFEAMYQTGFYWNFLGWGQVIAALLVMTQRFAAVGAFLFYPIIINIWLVTWSIGFKGTPVVTFMMFLANTYLLLWEYRRWVPLFQRESALSIPPSNFDDTYMRKPIWVTLGVFLTLCIFCMAGDLKRSIWYVVTGFFVALGVFLMYLFPIIKRFFRSSGLSVQE